MNIESIELKNGKIPSEVLRELKDLKVKAQEGDILWQVFGKVLNDLRNVFKQKKLKNFTAEIAQIMPKRTAISYANAYERLSILAPDLLDDPNVSRNRIEEIKPYLDKYDIVLSDQKKLVKETIFAGSDWKQILEDRRKALSNIKFRRSEIIRTELHLLIVDSILEEIIEDPEACSELSKRLKSKVYDICSKLDCVRDPKYREEYLDGKEKNRQFQNGEGN